MRWIVLAAGIAATTGEAHAEPAMELGALLAAETPCEITFDQAAIERWIEANVAEDDLQFGTMLPTMRRGFTRQLEQASEGERMAQCAQARRSARALGLIAPE